MGYYINPTNQSKVEFCASRCREVTRAEFVNFDLAHRDIELPICLIDNGFFHALGIAYNQGELEAFGRWDDMREKHYFIAPLEILKLPETGADLGFL